MRRLLLVTILLIVPLFLTGCGLKKKPAASSTDQASATPAVGVLASTTTGSVDSSGSTTYLTVDAKSLDSSIKANYDLAERKVKDWKSDAVLYHFSAKLTPGLGIGQVTEVYTYGSPTDAYNWWTLNASGKTGKSVRAIIPKEDYLGTSLQPVPLKFWQTNYVEALQLAEANGGADFRQTHPDAQVTINLAVGQPKNFLWWSVEYQSATSEPYKILINPSTKEVVAADGTQAAAPATTAAATVAPAATATAKAKASPTATTRPSVSPSSAVNDAATLEE